MIRTLICLLALIPVTSAKSAVVYLYPLTPYLSRIDPMDRAEFGEDMKKFAAAARIGYPVSPNTFEIRVWRLSVMDGAGTGYVVRDNLAKTFELARWRSGYRPTKLRSRAGPIGNKLKAQLRLLSHLDGRDLSCGVVDGENIYIEASIDNSILQVGAVNPTECKGEDAKSIALLLDLARLQIEKSQNAVGR
jgi:hypothetical protein